VGEEAYWLARTLPGVAVYTGSCRHAAGTAAYKEIKPDLFLLDDGFQHFQLHRDLDIVLLDAEAPWGNGYLLPRGPLREPLKTLAVAHLLILTRFLEDRHGPQLLALKKRFPQQAFLTAAISPVTARCYPGGEESPPEALQGLPLLAFAGLARPGVFTQTLAELGVELKGCRAFPDHYDYQPQDLQALVREAGSRGAAALITTAKDWARLGETWEGALPLWVLEVEARLTDPLPEAMLGRIS
jgi:tetraacyldisaccharide 4'-kinase